MLNKYWWLIIVLIIIIFSIAYIFQLAKEYIPSQTNLCKQGIELYKNYQVKGRVVKKFINKKIIMTKR